MARRVQLQGQPGFSRSLLVPVAGEPVACRGRYIGFGAVVNCRRGCLRFPVAPAKAGAAIGLAQSRPRPRSEEHTSELQSLMRISYAVFCLKKKTKQN